MADPSAADIDPDTLRVLIDTVREDITDIETFYAVSFSAHRLKRMHEYLKERQDELESIPYRDLDLQSQVDYNLLQKQIAQRLYNLHAFKEGLKDLEHLIEPFATPLCDLIDKRQRCVRVDGKDAAGILDHAAATILEKTVSIGSEKHDSSNKKARFAAFRAVALLQELTGHLKEWYGFYNGYDPLFSWWIQSPYKELFKNITAYAAAIREHLVGLAPTDEDAIVGQPIGRDALLASLDFAFIAYTPEELIKLAEQEYAWCEKQAKQASFNLIGDKDWRLGFEKAKEMHVAPGEQPYLVRSLADEALEYVKKHDMISVPKVASECWPTVMMTPERQKINPFFTGGDEITVSYPTDTMTHGEKLMSMRGNSAPMSRSTVFHELIPGHHLQFHYFKRYRNYRLLFMEGHWVEGWAFYWEMLLWDRDFPATPANKLGMLFWRMHRCIRIIFSLQFHLGKATPEECIDMLVQRVGHERKTAEGEVRRSFNGDYDPLYQAAYMVGALQFYALRREMVEHGEWTEKQFHDTVMKQGTMPLEMLRALLQKTKLGPDHRAEWRFYDFHLRLWHHMPGHGGRRFY